MTHHLSSDDDGGDFFFDKPPEPRHRYPTNTTSRSPHRPRHRHNNHKSPKRNTMTTSPKRQSRSPKRQSKSPKRNKAPADMTVICHRVFLFDNHNHNNNYCRKQQQQQQQYCETNNSDDDNNHHYHHNLPHPNLPVAPYDFVANETTNEEEDTIVQKQRMMKKNPCPLPTVAVIRAPQQPEPDNEKEEGVIQPDNRNVIMDSSIPNPHDPSVVHDKYWAQRRRLFSNFDMGIQLDAEGWYSVTPETIANHVAQRLVSTYTSSNNNNNNLIVMDAFCGCGGNAIAFGRNPHIALVVCVDVDRTKLRMAAYNACLYGIPKEKILFVECTSLFVLQHCYFDGQLRLDRLPPHHAYGGVETEVSSGGFFIGGLGLLPSRIDAVFMDPPWGGVDYNSLGKNGYCLEKHMKILKWQSSSLEDEEDEDDDDDDDEQPEEIGAGLGDDFFDSFGTTTHHHHNNNKNKKKKKNSSFNQKQDESEYWNGVDLLQVAASSTKNRWIIYDLPRNTSKTSLAKCALAAGYRGNVKLEEHYLNGRLKTVTAYLGIDHTPMLTTTTTTTNNSSNSQQEA